MKVRNIDPNGARIVPVGNLEVSVEGGAVHDFPDELGARLCEQVDVWQAVAIAEKAKTKEESA